MSGIPALIASIGFRAIGGKVLGGAASGVKAAGKWIGSLDLVHVLLLAVTIALAVDHIGLVMAHRHSAKVEVQLVSANNALGIARANETTLKNALAKQNGAVAALGQQSAQQQNIAAKASQAAQERAREAEVTAARLRAGTRPAGSQRPPAANCEPSDTLKGQWK